MTDIELSLLACLLFALLAYGGVVFYIGYRKGYADGLDHGARLRGGQ